MARRITSVEVTMYLPASAEGKAELASRIAGVHADVAAHRIQELRCPLAQKIALADAVVRTARERARAAERER